MQSLCWIHPTLCNQRPPLGSAPHGHALQPDWHHRVLKLQQSPAAVGALSQSHGPELAGIRKSSSLHSSLHCRP